MKNIILLILISYNCSSQNLSEKEVAELSSFGIDLNQLDLNNQENSLNLNLILKKEKKRKLNKTLGVVLASISIVSISFGIAAISETRGASGHGEAYGGLIGGFSIALGGVSAGVSIPLFISSKKRKKERNALIEKLKLNYL